jgi:streptomycin 6-kinase
MTPPSNSDLGARVQNWVRRWGLEVERTTETGSSTLVFGRRGSQPVVLKVSRDGSDEWKGGEVLTALNGAGVVRVYEQAPGAVLLERLSPGTPLVDLVLAGEDVTATAILADVIAAMSPPEGRPDPTVGEWGHGFNRYARSLKCYATPAAALAEERVTLAAEVYATLERSQSRPRLLHGDLQHYNVLLDQRRGWLAIDPKGVVGELEYELGASLRNPTERPDLCASRPIVERRIRQFEDRLGIDPERTLAWAFAQGVLSAIWSLEDGEPVTRDHAGLQLAQAIEPMLPRVR